MERLTLLQIVKSRTVQTAAAQLAVNVWQFLQTNPDLHFSPATMTAINFIGTTGIATFRALNKQKPPEADTPSLH